MDRASPRRMRTEGGDIARAEARGWEHESEHNEKCAGFPSRNRAARILSPADVPEERWGRTGDRLAGVGRFERMVLSYRPVRGRKGRLRRPMDRPPGWGL
ncbi:MAG: hypothetical protein D6788_11475 [Planctomycetota bacterium]|nr:MAG: hypothetical protein D6788_11475 [Planctomycetota bacterium]